MGIERFFNSIIQNKTIQSKEGHFILEHKLKADFMMIDFNSILYKVANEIEEELNHLLYDIIYKLNEDGTLIEKSREIAVEWGFSLDNNSSNLEKFKKYFTEEVIDNMSITKVKNHLLIILDSIIDGINIKKIKISMDGIPNMGKIVEQKKRRYNQYIINKLKKELYVDHLKNLDDKRRIFEENKLGFNRNKILAWNSFMTRVSVALTDEKYTEKLKSKYKHLEEFVFSGANVPGEGEKKIMEYVLNNKDKGKHIIYSPDSDVIILSMILANKLINSQFYMMHFEQNKKEYTVIDINKLIQNIFNYVKSRVNKSIADKLNMKNVTDDITVLLSMFGNDFIPKIESLDVRKDFVIIINKYCEILDNSTNNIYYITSTHISGGTRINYLSLRNFFKKLGDVEHYLIKDTFIANNYNNYKKLKEQLNVNNLYIWLINYVDNANKLLNDIYLLINKINNKLIKDSTIENCYELLEPYIRNLYKKYNKEFLIDFVTIESNKKKKFDEIKNKENDKQLEKDFNDKIKSFFIINKTNSSTYCKVEVKLKLRLIPFDNNIEAKFHQDNLQKLKVIEYMNITEYDKENYLMERMMGRFKRNLNVINNKVGNVNLTVEKTSSTKKFYKIITSSIEEDYNNYYKTYFNTSPNSTEISKHCEEYISGLFWVTDFYFNKNDIDNNYNNVSIWFYKHHRPPLLREITYYLFQNKYLENQEYIKSMNHIFSDVLSKIVNRDKFLNSREQYFYITPKNALLNNVPEKINEILKNDTYEYLYPDLDIIVNKIYKVDKLNTENQDKLDNNIPIDCSTATFFNKCNLSINPVTFDEFIKIVEPIRYSYKFNLTIKNPFIIKFNIIKDFDKDNIISNIKNKINDLSISDLSEYKILCKEEYKKTKVTIYKFLYKMAKKRLLNNKI